MPKRIFEQRETMVNGNEPNASAKLCGNAPNMNGRLAVMANKTTALISMTSAGMPEPRHTATAEATTRHALKTSVSYSEVTKSLTI